MPLRENDPLCILAQGNWRDNTHLCTSSTKNGWIQMAIPIVYGTMDTKN